MTTTTQQAKQQTTLSPLQQATDAATLVQLKAMGFSDDIAPTPRRLICAVGGREFSGKTHFAFTAPGPIIFFDVDIGTEGVVNKFQGKGKQIFIYPVSVPKGADTSKDVYSALWAETTARIKKAYTLKRGTVVWDTETEINELARLANFGKLTQVMPHNYAKVNRELRDIMDWAYDSTMNSIFIRKMKPKWVNNARTSDYEEQGWGDMEYKCQVNLTMYREDTESGPEFCALIRKSRQNPNISNVVLRGPMNTFEFLLNLVHGKQEADRL